MHFVAGLLGAAVLTAVSLLVASWRSLRAAVAAMKHYPGPKPRWPTGTTSLFFGADGKARHLSDVYQELRQQYGKIFSFFLAVRPVLVISDLDAVKEVTVQKFRIFHDRPEPIVVANATRRDTILSGILNARGALWASVRGAAQPTFHTDSLQRYSGFMNDVGTQMLDTIAAEHLDGAEFDVSHLLHTAGLAIIFKCAFGFTLSEQSVEAQEKILHAGKRMFSVPSLTGLMPRLVSICPRGWQRPIESLAAALCGEDAAEERSVMYAVVDQLVRNYCAVHPEVEAWPDTAAYRRLKGDVKDLLPADVVPSEDSVLVAIMRGKNKQTGKPLTPSEVLQQGVTFLLAGYETTATTLSFALSNICTQPEVEAKLLEEIRANGMDSNPDFASLERWPYAKAIMYETMRLRPIGAVLARSALQDTTVAGRPVPRGTTVHIDIRSIHMDDALWPQPHAFRPERFVQDPEAARSHKFLGFGFGPRNCIGMRFAMEEAVTLMVRLYQKYSLKLSQSRHPDNIVKAKVGMLLQTENGVWVTASAR